MSYEIECESENRAEAVANGRPNTDLLFGERFRTKECLLESMPPLANFDGFGVVGKASYNAKHGREKSESTAT